MIRAMRRVLYLLLWLAGTLAGGAVAASVNVQLDRPVISEAETFRLTIEALGEAASLDPDFSPLRDDFHILGTGKSRHVSIRNGQMSVRTEWVVNLAPRRSGELSIPAIRVGSELTGPLRIEVKKSPVQKSETGGRDILLETEVDRTEPYVQEQVVYTVRLYYSLDMASGQLSEPESDGAVVHRLGEEARYQTQRDGRPYWVLERHFAVFPQTVGQITIRSPVFNGDVSVKKAGQASQFGPFFQRTRPVREHGEDLVLAVRLPPYSQRGQDWLPAKHLTLSEGWQPDPPEFRLGEPVTRSVIVTAWGADDAQLPTLELATGRGFKAYPDKDSRDIRSQELNLVSRRVQRVTLVTTEEGEFTLPKLEVSWWDTVEDREKTVTLPTRVIKVLPQVSSKQRGGAGTPGSSSDFSTAGRNVKEPEWPTAMPERGASWPRLADLWPWLAGTIFVTWLGTLWLWRRERRGREGLRSDVSQAAAPVYEEPEQISVRAARNALDQACRANDARAARDALLAWATAVWHENAPYTLVELSERFRDPRAHEAIASLDRAIYTRNEEGWNGQRFWESVSPLLKKPQRARKKADKHSLPELSPRI